MTQITFFQSWQFAKMFIGKLLCGVGRGHLETAAWLRFCSMPNSLIKNHKTPACAQWSRYLGCADTGKVKCVMFNSWWTGINNSKFHYLWDKGLCVVIIVKVKKQKMTSSYWIKVGIDLTFTHELRFEFKRFAIKFLFGNWIHCSFITTVDIPVS